MNSGANAIVNEFLVETFENLSNISEELTKYEKQPEDKELLNSIYRKVHTIKGSAGFLGYKNLEKLNHLIENKLDLVREGELELSASLVDIILEGFDYCHKITKIIEENGKEEEEDLTSLFNKIEGFREEGKPNNTEKKLRQIVPDVDLQLNDLEAELEALKEVPSTEEVSKVSESEVNELDALLASVDEAPKEKEVEEVKIEENTLAQAEKEPVKTSPKPEATKKESSQKVQVNTNDSTVRVNVGLLDKIMNVVGELVLNRNQILQFSKMSDDPDLNRYAHQLNVITTELQTDIMTTRMQPVGNVFSKFERVVRDISRSQKKRVSVDIQGQETELDKTILEVIKDPITHLIRNSVDHGIESPENREAAGKKAEGLLSIKAYHEGGQVVIEIKDDGGGINSEKVLKKAIEKKLVTAEAANGLSDKQILYFIFQPGFSTAEQVTNISGRGVGMDVVRSNIEKIGGQVEVSSTLGKGTSFRLKIPLTLAIVPALIIKSGAETFALPQKNLVELVMLDEDQLGEIEKIHGSEFFRIRGDLIPLFRLNDRLSLEKRESTEHLTENIVILEAEGKVYGLIVDEVLDTQEIVVKPLSRKLKSQNVYAGATIMGDGNVALILDAFGFYNMLDQGRSSVNSERENLEGKSSELSFDDQELLLFSLGGEEGVFGIPLVLINRLEEFPVSRIEWSGTQAIVKYGSDPMPIYDLGKYLKSGDANLEKLESAKEQKEVALCFVAKQQGQLFGIMVDEILDIAYTKESIQNENLEAKGIVGTVYHGNKLVTLIDIHRVIKDSYNFNDNDQAQVNGRVLLVDDSGFYRKIQTDLLRDLGLEVISVVNGQEAIDRMSFDDKFDLILTDIEMPVMNGWDLIKKIREEEKWNDLPVVAVSTRVAEKDKQRCQEIGLNAYLEKLNKEEVLEHVSSYFKN